MDMYGSLFSASCVLNEQVARQVFDVIPEQGPVVVIMDKEGHYWPSDTERFSDLAISESFLREVCSKIDDGAEPVVTQVEDCSIIASQLATERTNCGYVVIILSHYGPESTLINIDLIEMLLSQMAVIANLIEKNNLLYELQMKHCSMYGESEAGLN